MKEAGLYIHIPFCANKCLYCDFVSYTKNCNSMLPYVNALKNEILNTAKNIKIKSIFIGGGTPTFLSLEALKIVGEAIKQLNISDDIEFSVEANPGTVTIEKLEYLKSIGVNRISFGLQAWQNTLLEKIGRIHKIEDFIDSYNMARSVGFKNINIDLMFALPEQTLEDWIETLNNVIELNPEHISAYSLILEEGTPLYNMYENGKYNYTDEEVERSMYKELLSIMKEKGYNQYEISNFSKRGYECKHNIIYWSLDEYIGVGASSHSFVDNFRYNNSEGLEEYIRGINESSNATFEKIKCEQKDLIEEYTFLRLRLREGINITHFKEKFKVSIYDVYKDVLKKYIDLNLLIEKDNKIFLTEDGISVSNTIMSDFLI